MTVVAFPDEIRAVRSASFRGWSRYPLSSPLGYLALERATAGESRPSLTVTVTDARVTKNLNPLTVEFRNKGFFTGLLYDPPCRWVDGDLVPWLASETSWSDDSLRIDLRDSCRWHDDTAVTADDVAFTYRFLQDTTLGRADRPIPAPRFRGRSSLVDTVTVVDDRTIRLEFDEVSRDIARRTLTLPILPEHVWASRTDDAGLVGGLGTKDTTEAVVVNNIPTVGSGPLQFERAIGDEALILSRNDDHFLNRGDGERDSDFDGYEFDTAFERLTARVTPSAQAAVEIVAADQADAAVTAGAAGVVPTIGREDGVSLNVHSSRSFYHVGYNCRRPPLQNVEFRRIAARLIDKESIVSDVFDGYARPGATPLAGTQWMPEDLRWDDGDTVSPFLGTDGELSTTAAREAFVDAGYRYEDDALVGGST